MNTQKTIKKKSIPLQILIGAGLGCALLFALSNLKAVINIIGYILIGYLFLNAIVLIWTKKI